MGKRAENLTPQPVENVSVGENDGVRSADGGASPKKTVRKTASAKSAKPAKRVKKTTKTTDDVQEAAPETEKVAKKTVKKTTKKVVKKALKSEKAKEPSVSESAAVEIAPEIPQKEASPKKKAVRKATKKAVKTKKKSRKKTAKTAANAENAQLAETAQSAEIAEFVAETPELAELNALNAALSSVELSEAERNRRERREVEKLRFQSSPLELEYSQKLPAWEPGWLFVRGARRHNLKSIDVPFPLSAFTAVVGVSGGGKSSLVEDVLYRSLARILNRAQTAAGACDAVLGFERLNKVVQVDQNPIGQTPTSNAATYCGVFDLIRRLYAQLPEAKMRGYSPRRFSFNVPGGRCEKCEGAGRLKVEMHFLADVWIECDACGGRRYDAETLQVKFRGKSIADALETTCGDALRLFERIPAITRILRTLCDVGLDYLPLGQPATTLSGGEAQRVKLAAELSRIDSGRTLYVLDEPTTGLHFEDVRKLLDVLHRLVDLGNTVVVVEHNLDVVKNADWIVEIGPEAGLEGGRLVYAGLPEGLVEYAARWKAFPELQKTELRSRTGEALIPVFLEKTFAERPVLDVREYWESQKTPSIESEEVAEEVGSEKVAAPWETDGRRWHCETRTSRTGAPCRWDGNILAAVVDRIEESSFFAETDWNNKTIVEIRSEKKSLGWFLHAITGEEWLLKLKFRTAKNTFSRDLLSRKLALKTLNEMDEIPLYGTQPRVKLESVGPWQEVELKLFSFEEIDRPEFWEFVDLAIERFGELTDRAKENAVDLTPWKSKARDWHTSPIGCDGGSDKPRWTLEILEKTFEIVESVSNNEANAVWTNKILVPFSFPGAKRPWCQVYTKNSDAICVQVNAPKGTAPLGRVADIGVEPEVDATNLEYDAVYLRFRAKNDFDAEKLRAFLAEIFEKLRETEEK